MNSVPRPILDTKGLHPETRLSAEDVETVCAAARKAHADAAVGR